MKMARAILFLTLLAVTGGCCGAHKGEPGAHREPATERRQVTGTVKHIDLEGGFYGIVTDDARKLDPVNLPDVFKQDGVRVKVRVDTLEGQASVHMWGTPVRIVEIERVQ